MLTKIHSRLGTAGFVISIVALVAALGGGAYAASGGLTGKQKKEVEKIAKKYAGKPGPAGAAGPAGAKGDTGSKGDAGAKGDAGSNGAPGANGTNGTAGARGPEGSPWTAGGTLPEGATETGTIAVSQAATTELGVLASISFPIPLEEEGRSLLEENGAPKAGSEASAFVFSPSEVAAGDTGKKVFVEPSGEKFVQEKGCKPGPSEPNCLETGCKGSAAEPTAPAGVLCVYLSLEERRKEALGEPYMEGLNSGGATPSAYGKTGAILTNYFLNGDAANPAVINAYGSWAVTAP